MDESVLNEMFGGPLQSFDFFYHMFADNTEEARFYFDTLVDFIESQEQKEIQRLEEVAKTVPNNCKRDFWENNYPFHWKDIFAENLKESFIVSLFSMLEVYLQRTCDILHDGKSKQVVNCKGNSKFHKFRKCLEQYVPVISSLDWDQIYKLWRIRCVITHNQGQCVSKNDNNLLNQFANKTEGISIRDGWIQIDLAFCKNTLQTVREFGLGLGRIIRDDITNRGS